MHKNETFWRQLLKQYLIDVRHTHIKSYTV